MKGLLRVSALAFAATAFACSASATTIWDVNASFTYNSTGNLATGTITLDPSLNLVSWDVTVTGTNTAADNEYTSGDSIAIFPDLTHLDFYDGTTNQYINLFLSSPFTNAGGTIALLAGDEGQTNNSTVVCAGCGVLAEGTLAASSSATPEPSSIALLGTGLLGFAGLIRRRLS